VALIQDCESTEEQHIIMAPAQSAGVYFFNWNYKLQFHLSAFKMCKNKKPCFVMKHGYIYNYILSFCIARTKQPSNKIIANYINQVHKPTIDYKNLFRHKYFTEEISSQPD
jgi:hypothetical protein